MTRDNLRELLDRDRFVPFRPVMTSGKAYDVRSPDLAMLLKSEVFVVFPDGERWAHVPLSHIASSETLADGEGRRNTHRKRP